MQKGILHFTSLTRLNTCHLFFTVMVLLVLAGQTPARSNTNDKPATTNIITLNTNNDNVNLSPDFDGDGVVGIPDFLLFVNHFGLSRGDEEYDAQYDLDGNHTIGISDFLIFVDAFGKEVPSPVITIPDANLRSAIEAALSKASNALITKAEMGTLTDLNVWNAGISDLTGLESAINLTDLRLPENDITDIAALADLTNLKKLFLESSNITDISVLVGLSNLTDLSLLANPLIDSSVKDHIPAFVSRGVRVFFDSFRVMGDFDIELVFLDQFTEHQKRVLQYVARRWMAVITEDLPDYEFTHGWTDMCGDQAFEIPAGERIDDLRIYLSTFEGGKAVGWGGPRVLRDEIHLPVLGCMAFDLDHANLLITGLHEIGHVLGFGAVWDNFGFRQNHSPNDPGADTHFNGPLAIAAFNDAGGRNYTGAKVPVQKMDGSHWRGNVFDQGELMLPWGGGALSAITVQSLADLGYGVDVTQADAYTLPGAASKASTKIAAALPSIPIDGVDVTQFDAYTKTVVGPHWQGKVSEAVPSISGDDRLRGHLESTYVDRDFDFDVRDKRLMGRLKSPTQAEPLCGFHLRREPIHVVNQQGRIIRTISH